jgi:ArsR family metal-binding transcriptional regulator
MEKEITLKLKESQARFIFDVLKRVPVAIADPRFRVIMDLVKQLDDILKPLTPNQPAIKKENNHGKSKSI